MVLSHCRRRTKDFVELRPAGEDQVRGPGPQAGVIPLEIATVVSLERQLTLRPVRPGVSGKSLCNNRQHYRGDNHKNSFHSPASGVVIEPSPPTRRGTALVYRYSRPSLVWRDESRPVDVGRP